MTTTSDRSTTAPDRQAAVDAHYREAAERIGRTASDGCCTGACCGDATSLGYDPTDLAGLPADASLGCGNPYLMAELRPGERVLDLGSGAGLDVLLSARRVGPDGVAYGVDRLPEMLAVARANQAAAGIGNAVFLEGSIDGVPLPDASLDAIISNCVINLADDKGPVFAEAFRLLRPGGRLAVSDVVATRPLPAWLRRDLAAWASCAAGALEVGEYRDGLQAAGFREVEVEIASPYTAGSIVGLASAYIRARRPETGG